MIQRTIQLTLLLVVAASSSPAQITMSTIYTPNTIDSPTPFGSPDRLLTRYRGEELPENLLFLDVDGQVAYDTNALNTNLGYRDDGTFSIGPRGGLVVTRRHLKLSVDYLPYFVLYRKFSQFNAFNQSLNLDATTQITSRLSFRVHDSIAHISTSTGVFEPQSGLETVPAPGSPTELNLTTLVPQAQLLEENARIDAGYQLTARSNIDLFGSFRDYRFGHKVISAMALPDLNGGGGGAGYSYRLSQNSTLGVMYQFQELSFSSGIQTASHSALLSYARQVSATVMITAFAGPQFAREQEPLTFSLASLVGSGSFAQPVRSQWSPAFGGALTKRSESTVLQVGGQRIVTVGGGFLQAATSTAFELGVRRRLDAHWQVRATAQSAQYDALRVGTSHSKIRYSRIGAGFERSLGEKLIARLEYNYLHQSSGGAIPLGANINRSRIGLSFFYQVGAIPVGP